jgi:hypothetical protein
MGFFGRKRKKLAVLITCADWRLHQRKVNLNARLAKQFRVDGFDYITVPGPDGLILPERGPEWAATLVQVKLLVNVHAPVALIVAGHQRCAGNPLADEAHIVAVEETASELKAAVGFSGPVHAVVLEYRSDKAWEIRPVAQY